MSGRERNLADKQSVKEHEAKDRRRRERELDDVRHILASEEGRRFVWRYLGITGVFQTSFTGSSETFFKEGQRNVGLKLIDDITQAEPESLIKMMKEKGDVNV